MFLKAKIKRTFLTITGKVRHLKSTAKCKSRWYGNAYGGFNVCPEFLTEKSIVYSFGIGEDISFDMAIIAKHNCQVYGFDPTPKTINWINGQHLDSKFTFQAYGISDKSGFVDFFLPVNHEHVSGSLIAQKAVDTTRKVSVEMKSIEDILAELNHTHIDILKMDIEGAEYQVIEHILEAKISITQILIEFHDRLFDDGEMRTKQAIRKLNKHGFEIFAVSDSLEEISFINKKLQSDLLARS